MVVGLPQICNPMNLRTVIFIASVLVLLCVEATASTFYVDLNSSNPLPPYANISTAANNIQDAVDAATNGDLVLVNDGVYQSGYRVNQDALSSGLQPKTAPSTNRLVLNKALTVQSVNGPAVTLINGNGVYRCAYLTNGATLSGFTLMNGQAGYITTTQSIRGFVTVTNDLHGGGAEGTVLIGGNSSTLSNCILMANVALGNGGGAYGCHLINCIISNNVATSGGGAYDSQLFGCLVAGNYAETNISPNFNPGVSSVVPGAGGGIYLCSATNCLIANNKAYEGGGVYDATGLVNCTVVSNVASFFGGVYLNGLSLSPYGYAYNCIIYYNAAGTNANFGTTNLFADHCCTFPIGSQKSDDLTGLGNQRDVIQRMGGTVGFQHAPQFNFHN